MFEPVPGSAPDIAGRGFANPLGAIGSAALMLEYLELPGQALLLRQAIEATTGKGVLTPDVGGHRDHRCGHREVLARLGR